MSLARTVRRSLALLAVAAACARPAAIARPIASAHDAAPPCRWPSPPEIVRRSADTLHLRWTAPLAALPDAWAPDALPALHGYRTWLADSLGNVDPRALLRRQIAYWSTQADVRARREADNGRLVLDGAVGTLRPIACLEARVDHERLHDGRDPGARLRATERSRVAPR